jgi:hypothetical protein
MEPFLFSKHVENNNKFLIRVLQLCEFHFLSLKKVKEKMHYYDYSDINIKN